MTKTCVVAAWKEFSRLQIVHNIRLSSPRNPMLIWCFESGMKLAEGIFLPCLDLIPLCLRGYHDKSAFHPLDSTLQATVRPKGLDVLLFCSAATRQASLAEGVSIKAQLFVVMPFWGRLSEQ